MVESLNPGVIIHSSKTIFQELKELFFYTSLFIFVKLFLIVFVRDPIPNTSEDKCWDIPVC